jgi:hypothetical protein
LDCRQIADILSRVMVINALRMLPVNIKGFHFLSKLHVHMKSYRAPIDEENPDQLSTPSYPKWIKSALNEIYPTDSFFDKVGSKRKQKASLPGRSEEGVGTDGHPRKYHKTF